jgi:hypothetical protein
VFGHRKKDAEGGHGVREVLDSHGLKYSEEKRDNDRSIPK